MGSLSVEEAPRRSCHLLPCHGAVVRRSALGVEVLKGLTSPVEHRRLAGVALPPAHRDVHEFRLQFNGAGAAAGLLRRDDGGAGPAERVEDDALALGHIPDRVRHDKGPAGPVEPMRLPAERFPSNGWWSQAESNRRPLTGHLKEVPRAMIRLENAEPNLWARH